MPSTPPAESVAGQACRTLPTGDGRPNQVTGTRTVSHRRARESAAQPTTPSRRAESVRGAWEPGPPSAAARPWSPTSTCARLRATRPRPPMPAAPALVAYGGAVRRGLRPSCALPFPRHPVVPSPESAAPELAHEHHHQHQHQHEAVASTDASEPPTSGEVSLRDLLTIAADVGLRYVLARQEMGTEGSPPARPLPPPGRRCRARRLPRRSQAGPCRTLSPGDGRPNQVTGTRTVSHRRARAPAVQLTSPSHLLRVPARRARLERRQPQLTHGPRQAAAPASAARARTPMPSAEAFGPAPPCPFPRSRRPFPPNAQRRA